MDFGVLGPLLVQDARGPVALASAKQRALLAILLLESPHSVVTRERLIDELWGEDPPPTAAKALQVHISQLRRALGSQQPIVTLPSGYAIHIDRDALDLHRFDALLSKARRLRTTGDLNGALAALQEALGLWRGPALADVTLLGPAATEAGRLEGLCAIAHEERLELELARGGGAAMVPELEALIAADPYREHMYALLMLALYRAGRQADALEVYRRARKVLIEDLGLEPGPELVGLEAAILAQDSSLDVPASTAEIVATAAPARAGSAAELAAPARAGASRAVASIVGREAEVGKALALIERADVRLVTMTGAGGIGKTRLALEIVAHLEQPAYWVELAAITEADRVLPAIAAAIGAQDDSDPAIADVLTREPTVLFLDNFEQVIDAAPAVADLVGALPSLTVVVTSRSPLRIAGEHELPVPPLSGDAAVELFTRRATEQTSAFSAEPEDLDCIAAICERIDRLPLAIELAAARVKVLRPSEILARIGQRLDLLTAGRRDAPERHRTLRATIAWSHELLDSEQQRLFEQLSVFHSGWTLEACEAVVTVPVIETLAGLVDHGLVIRDEGRFRMLETVRDYAAERLEASGEATEIRRRHASWFVRLAQTAEENLSGPEQAEWFARLDAERDNLHAAAQWAAASAEFEIALELTSALWRFWLARGSTAAREVLARALASGRGDAALRANGLIAMGILAGETGDVEVARSALEEALELALELGDRRQTARTLMNLGVVALYRVDYPAALTRYQQAGEIWQELGDLHGQSVMHQNMAIVHELMGDFERATPLLEESIELARAVGDGMHVAMTLVELGKHLVQHRPDDPRIADLLREGLELASALGEQRQTIEGLEVLAAFSARQGAPVTGAELIGAAEAERARVGRRERKGEEMPLFEATVRQLERMLGRRAYERAYLRGYSRGLDVAVAVALKSLDRVPGPARAKQAGARRPRLVRTE